MNNKLAEDTLRERLFILTGCEVFGNCDSTDKICIECSRKESLLYLRCQLFRNAMTTYGTKMKECVKKSEESISECNIKDEELTFYSDFY